MGTRSITHIYDNGEIVCSFYCHWDGHPKSHKVYLKNWLSSKRIVHCTDEIKDSNRDFHGVGSISVVLMYSLLNTKGCSVIPTGSYGYGESYTYHINYVNDSFEIRTEKGEAHEYISNCCSISW